MKHNYAQMFLFFLNLIAVANGPNPRDFAHILKKERAGKMLTKRNTMRHGFSFENASLFMRFCLVCTLE